MPADTTSAANSVPSPAYKRLRMRAAPDGPAPAGRRFTLWTRRSSILAHLWTAALVILLALFAAILTPLPEFFGWQVLAVQGGSMEPTIPLGSVIAVRPVQAAQLQVGDVITFADRNRPDLRVTHRIVGIETRNGERLAITKGDANNTTDSWNVPVDRAIGRVDLWLPYLGYVMVVLGLPVAKLATLGIVVLSMVVPAAWRVARGRPAPLQPDAESFDDLASEIDALLGDSKGASPAQPGLPGAEAPTQRKAGG